MSTGGKLLLKEREKKAFFEHERGMQPVADKFYRSRGHKIVTRNGCEEWDVVLKRGNRKDKVEEKFRDEDYGDFLVEVVQDLETGDLGWFFKTGCDYLHYFVPHGENGASGHKIYRIDFPEFKEWLLGFLEEKTTWGLRISARGWGLTLNLPLPWDTIPDRLYDIFFYPES